MGERQTTVVMVGALLAGCVPPGAVVSADAAPAPVALSPPSVPSSPSRASSRLDLDLSNLRDARSAWELRPVTARARVENGKRYHIVAAGETGIAIARAYRVRWADIVTANALVEPFQIRIGQRLLLPESEASSPEARAAAFRVGIDDIVTGGEPARRGITRESSPPDGTVRFGWPVEGKLVGRFGRGGSGRVNQGVDIDAARGAAVSAVADGVVAYVGNGVPGYGGLIRIRHAGGWISAYGRVARTVIAKDARVAKGEMIGRTGDDALHFELRRGRPPVDPMRYLAPR